MTKEELQIIKDRCNIATINNWFAVVEGLDQTSGSTFIMTGVDNIEDVTNKNRGEDFYITGCTNADIDFIANARQDVPALLAEVERLQKLLEEKNKIGVPINADDVFENIVKQTAKQYNTKLPMHIEELEVLFAIVDVTNLNATQVFNMGQWVGTKLLDDVAIAKEASVWRKEEYSVMIMIEISKPKIVDDVWQSTITADGHGHITRTLYGQSSMQALIFATQHAKLMMVEVIEEGYLYVVEGITTLNKSESLAYIDAVFGSATLMDEAHTKKLIIATIQRLQNAKGTEEEQNIDINYLKNNFSDPQIIDYIFHSKIEMTATEIYDKAKVYKPIEL